MISSTPSPATPRLVRRNAARGVIAAALVGIATAASAARPPLDDAERRYPVRVSLTEAGRVAAADAPARAVPKVFRDLVERAAARAVYVPARVAGQPVPSELWVTAVTRLDHEADGDLRATVVDVVPGGRVSSGRFSTLTPLVDGATGHGARVVVHSVFGPDGRSDVDASRVELIEMWRDDGRPVVDAHRDAHARAFIDAARSGLARWRWSPDTVDGEPIGGEFAVTLDFVAFDERRRHTPSRPAPPAATFLPRPPPGVEAPRVASWAPARSR